MVVVTGTVVVVGTVVDEVVVVDVVVVVVEAGGRASRRTDGLSLVP